MATGSGGYDVKRTLGYEATSSELTTTASARAVPFGVGASRYDISIDALTARKEYVKELLEKANSLLATAQKAFVVGASCTGDCTGMQAVQSWVGRLVSEEEHLVLEIRKFNEAEGAKKKKSR